MLVYQHLKVQWLVGKHEIVTFYAWIFPREVAVESIHLCSASKKSVNIRQLIDHRNLRLKKPEANPWYRRPQQVTDQ